jgi:uncharacterized membrane protein YraQ (UPF0718 family)
MKRALSIGSAVAVALIVPAFSIPPALHWLQMLGAPAIVFALWALIDGAANSNGKERA